MKKIVQGGARRFIFSLVAILLISAQVLSLAPAIVQAASVDSLYTYSLANASATIANTAAANTAVNLALAGNWTATSTGVQFSGNTINQQSVGYAKPASGYTLNIATTSGVGAAVLFKYQAPTSGGCFADSQNISQVGFFAANTAQVKLQLSNCSKSTSAVYTQCRFAGSSTASSVLPVTSTQALVDGQTYLLQCAKSPDPTTGNATVSIKTTQINPTGSNTVTSDTFSVAKTGLIRSTSYLSVGNKYPLPTQTTNTDQFNGEIQKVTYCKGSTLTAVQTCLDTELPAPSAPPASFADEIKYSYGENADEVVFNWRGTEQTIYYGLTNSLGQQALAGNSTITPTDIVGPFREAKISGLQPGTMYYYKIGDNGAVSTFKTIPTANFRWIDIGDTESTYSAPFLSGLHQLIASKNADFVTHGGDMTYMNYYGLPAIHAYYTDQEIWSRTTAFQPVWGNHEYGQPSATAPAGTPRDSMNNYKGRSYVTNAQTVPNDTTTKTSNPGCGEAQGSTTNTCRGEDWGWFKSSGVLFIAYPEPWTGALADWQTKADALMAQAQNDPSIDFIVTYGHRPPYTSTSEGPNLEARGVIEALATKYSPRPDNPNGKYVLSVAHHAHSQEVFAPINGLTHIVNAAGTPELINFTNITPESLFRMRHVAVLQGDYDATNHTLSISLVCGPDEPNETAPCATGSTQYTVNFSRNTAPPTPDPASLTTSITDSLNSTYVGQNVTYSVSLANVGDEASTDTILTATFPSNITINDSAGGVVSGNDVSWSIGELAGNQQRSFTVTGTVTSGSVGDTMMAAIAASSSNNACSPSTSVCNASDATLISTPPPAVTEWILNTSVETDLSGWTGKYGSSPFITVARSLEAAHSGAASIKVTGLTGASNLSSGFNDNPRWVTSAVAGKTYNGSVWVKPGVSGQNIVLRIREWSGSTLVTDKKVTLVSSGTGWQQISGQLIAAQNGTQLAFAVYGAGMNAGSYFYADDFSLTSSN